MTEYLRNDRTHTLVGLIVCFAVLAWWLIQSLTYLPHDYSNSYFGAYFFLHNQFDTWIFDPYAFNKKIYDEGFRQVFASYNPNPPSTAVLFAPLALIPLAISKFLFNVASCVLFCVSLYRLCKHYQISVGFIFAAVPLLFFIPMRNQVLFGQTYFLLFALLAEGYLAHEKKYHARAAVLWSMAIFLKVFPVIIFFWLLLRKQWKPLAYLAASCIILMTACVSLQGVEVWKVYITDVLPRNGKGEISWAYTTNYQSAFMFFKHAFVEDTALHPDALVDSPFLFISSQVIFKSIAVALCASSVLLLPSSLSFGFVLLTGILLSAYGSTYTNILLVFLLLALPNHLPRQKLYVVLGLTFLICNVPLSVFQSLPPVMQFPRLLLTVALIIVMCIFLKIELRWKYVAAFVVLFTITTFTQTQHASNSKPLLAGEKHSIIYDYGMMNGFIFYRYWSENGENNFVTTVAAQTLQSQDVVLENNQVIYRGRQLTHSPDKKLKPMLMNNNVIVYLSDHGRGNGFYNLRVLNLPE